MDDDVQALGWVPVEGRGSLPFALVHGESLVAAASWAVGEAGVQLYDASVGLDALQDSGRPLLVHDPLCPLTPADFLAGAVEHCLRTGRTVVGFRPVTDTVKVQREEVLGATVDRSRLRAVTSPVVIPSTVLGTLETLGTEDFPTLVARLAQVDEIAWLEAPAIAGRITGQADLEVLEALSRSLAGEAG